MRIAEPEDVRVVVGDTHGDHVNMLGVLRKAGAVDVSGQRVPGFWTCHVGDVIHAGHGVQRDDAICLELALELFDCLLYGNHEVPFALGFGGFQGQNRALECQCLLERSVRDGRWSAATAVDGYLISHAGLHPALTLTSPAFERLRQTGSAGNACRVADAINTALEERVATQIPDPLFDSVGRRRGGSEPYGGIFWCDWQELLHGARRQPSQIAQVVGHTPGRSVRTALAGRLCNIDVGAALSGYVAAIVKEADVASWTALLAGTGRPARGPSHGTSRGAH